MKKYNLTFWQRIELCLIFPMWLLADPSKRKTWHELKKGMEHHEHVYDGEIFIEQGIRFQKCSHECCDLVNPLD